LSNSDFAASLLDELTTKVAAVARLSCAWYGSATFFASFQLNPKNQFALLESNHLVDSALPLEKS
jgi:hypothetical protein